jgi:serine/threonine protein kinase
VKRLKPGAIVGNAASEFEAKMAIMRTTHHQNLVVILDFCLDGDEKLMVYEYMAQGTLSGYIFN